MVSAELTSLTNAERTAYQLPALRENSLLDEAASLKAHDMATKGYFAHVSPTGLTPWYWFGLVGYNYEYAGENLAINFSNSVDVANAWMNSPTHRANILKSNYTEIGTGIAYGMWQGKEVAFIAQEYGNHPNSLPVVSSYKKIWNTAKAKKTVKTVAKKKTNSAPVKLAKSNSAQVLGAETVATPTYPVYFIYFPYFAFGLFLTSSVIYTCLQKNHLLAPKRIKK